MSFLLSEIDIVFLTMAPKKITVVDASSTACKNKLSNEDEYRNLLKDYDVLFLIDGDDYAIRGFASLTNGGTYTLGDAAEQQQPGGELRCCSRILVFNMLFEYEYYSLFLWRRVARLVLLFQCLTSTLR